MKIHILANLQEGPTGGGNQFLKAFRNYLDEKALYTSSVTAADIVLFNSFPFDDFRKIKELAQARCLGKTIVHRVDGPISIVRGKDRLVDHLINCINAWFTDATIFQSDWSRHQCQNLGMVRKNYETTVINGSDPTIFYPVKGNLSTGKPQKIRIVATSWSNNWRKGFDVYAFLEKHLDFDRYEFTFIGNSPILFQNSKKLAPLGSKDLGEILRQQDFYLTASVNDPCSNSLIEAINCGLPCLVRNSGGHPEIIKSGGLTFEGNQDILPAIENMSQKLNELKNQLPSYSIQQSAEQYLAFMQKIPRRGAKGQLIFWKITYLYALTYFWHWYVYISQGLTKRLRPQQALKNAGVST